MKYLLPIILIIGGCASHHHYPDRAVTVKQRPKVQQRTECIMIDAGHGGEDFGTHSLTPPRYQEKYFNLATAYLLKSYLQEYGYQIAMTRQTDHFVSLDHRVELANTQKPKLFVSVHYNAAPSPKAEGVEVFFYRSKKDKQRAERSKDLAQKVLDKILVKTEAKSRGVKHGDFAVIRETEMPAILVEGGFLTNENEMAKLKDTQYLRQIARGIAEGIHQHLSN